MTRIWTGICRLWNRFVESSFEPTPDPILKNIRSPLGWAEFRARFNPKPDYDPPTVYVRHMYRTTEVEPGTHIPAHPLGRMAVRDDTDYVNVLDGWGNVVDRLPVRPQLVRPYLDKNL